ncbi:MAG: hypothetical protein M5R41_07690 [Bacteroidia bacterium]|nr:hypothetical protein [Bacteroidia bacterium]
MSMHRDNPLQDRHVRKSLRLLSFVLALCLLALLALSLTAVSQTQPVRLSGSLGVSTELYSSSSSDPQWTPRSDQHVSRAVLRTTLTLYDQIDLPFEAYISTQSSGYHQPFNQFGVSPLIAGWLRLHGGYFSSRVSELTFGDERLLGGGIDMSPGPWRITALYGRARQGLAPDTAAGFGGDYRRMVTAAKVGYGKEGEFFLHLNAMRATDDTATFRVDEGRLAPAARENTTASLGFGFPVGTVVRIAGEAALSHTINDLRVRSRDGYTAQVDGAAKVNLLIMPAQSWQVALNSRWIGPGYFSLGYVQLPNDVFEFTLAPMVRLSEQRMHVRGSLGVMFNNLRNNRLARTTRLIGSLSGSWQISEQLGISTNYSNYGMRSTHTKDSLRIDHLTHSLYLSPTYTFDGFGGDNSINLNLMVQSATDGNPVTTEGNKNSSEALSLMHTLLFPSTLSLTTGVTWNSMASSFSDTRILSFTETVGHNFFNNTLSTSLTGGYNIVSTATTEDTQFSLRLSLGYTIEDYGTLSLALSNNNYSYGQSVDRPSYDEWFGSLQYSVGF